MTKNRPKGARKSPERPRRAQERKAACTACVWAMCGPSVVRVQLSMCGPHTAHVRPTCSLLSPHAASWARVWPCVWPVSKVWLKFGWGLSDIMLLYYAFSMQTQQPDIINPIQYNSGNLEIAGLWLVELCPLNPIKRVRSYSIVYYWKFYPFADSTILILLQRQHLSLYVL